MKTFLKSAFIHLITKQFPHWLTILEKVIVACLIFHRFKTGSFMEKSTGEIKSFSNVDFVLWCEKYFEIKKFWKKHFIYFLSIFFSFVCYTGESSNFCVLMLIPVSAQDRKLQGEYYDQLGAGASCQELKALLEKRYWNFDFCHFLCHIAAKPWLANYA